MTYKLNGETLQPGRPFETEDGTQYPGNWLDVSTPEQREELGIVWVEPAAPPTYDQRFYWGPGNPKDLDQLKSHWSSKQKSTAGDLLSKTDWYVIRQSEDPACVCPPEVIQYRHDVRSVSDIREQQIEDCAKFDELCKLLNESTIVVDGVVVLPNHGALQAWPETP